METLLIISVCSGLFMMSIILGIIIVYIIDKKLSNVVVKIPKIEPVVINRIVHQMSNPTHLNSHSDERDVSKNRTNVEDPRTLAYSERYDFGAERIPRHNIGL